MDTYKPRIANKNKGSLLSGFFIQTVINIFLRQKRQTAAKPASLSNGNVNSIKVPFRKNV